MVIVYESKLDIMGRDEFIQFSNTISDDKCLELTEKTYRLTDGQLADLMYETSNCKNIDGFQALDVITRDRYIKQMEKGMSIREMSRITGVSIGDTEQHKNPEK